MITTEQIRMARGALDWTIADLEKASGVSARTIRRIEAQAGLPSARPANILIIQRAFEDAGIEFIGAPDDRPGVRLGRPLGVVA